MSCVSQTRTSPLQSTPRCTRLRGPAPPPRRLITRPLGRLTATVTHAPRQRAPAFAPPAYYSNRPWHLGERLTDARAERPGGCSPVAIFRQIASPNITFPRAIRLHTARAGRMPYQRYGRSSTGRRQAALSRRRAALTMTGRNFTQPSHGHREGGGTHRFRRQLSGSWRCRASDASQMRLRRRRQAVYDVGRTLPSSPPRRYRTRAAHCL